MHPYHHALSSVKKHGGHWSDYIQIHDWFDESKSHYADMRHRALRHHAQGIFMAQEKFGRFITNIDGKQVPVRFIGEQHVKEDCGGFIPTIEDWFKHIGVQKWMMQPGHRFDEATQTIVKIKAEVTNG